MSKNGLVSLATMPLPYPRWWPSIGHGKASTYTYRYVYTGWHDVIRPCSQYPCSIVEHQPWRVPGWEVAVVPWHVIDVCVMAIMLSSMRTTIFQPSGLSLRLMRNVVERGTGSEGRGVMVRVLYGERLTTLEMILHSPVLNPQGVLALQATKGRAQVRRGVRVGQKKTGLCPIAPIVHRA